MGVQASRERGFFNPPGTCLAELTGRPKVSICIDGMWSLAGGQAGVVCEARGHDGERSTEDIEVSGMRRGANEGVARSRSVREVQHHCSGSCW